MLDFRNNLHEGRCGHSILNSYELDYSYVRNVIFVHTCCLLEAV